VSGGDAAISVDAAIFDELLAYTGFGAEDEASLRSLHPLAAPRFQAIADRFYDRILSFPPARAVLESGESSVGRLKVTLVRWLDELLSGPWDAAYFERRCRIGRVHVRIGLPQHYMFGAMSVVRDGLDAVADQAFGDDSRRRASVGRALGRVLDIELAIMLHTYREDLLSQQARSERLATFGQLMGSIGHELRNPLAVIESSLFLLEGRAGDDPRTRKHLTRIGEQVSVANRIIGDLLDLIRDRPVVATPVDLAAALRAALEALKPAESIDVAVVGLEEAPAVLADASQLRQVCFNLIDNALQAARGAVRIGLSVDAAADRVVLMVDDDGPGVEPSVRHRLFEPLITTKPHGSGLGLALVRRIVERYGGSVHYEPSPSGGARFVVRLRPAPSRAGES